MPYLSWLHKQLSIQDYLTYLRQSTTWCGASSMTTLPLPMSTPSRIQQIIDHERAIYRSLPSFGLALTLVTASLLFLALRS